MVAASDFFQEVDRTKPGPNIKTNSSGYTAGKLQLLKTVKSYHLPKYLQIEIVSLRSMR